MNYLNDYKRMALGRPSQGLHEAEQKIGKGDCGYVAFYKGKRYEVYGDTLLKARDALAAHLKLPAKKHADINIKLAQKDGKDVVHVASESVSDVSSEDVLAALHSLAESSDEFSAEEVVIAEELVGEGFGFATPAEAGFAAGMASTVGAAAASLAATKVRQAYKQHFAKGIERYAGQGFKKGSGLRKAKAVALGALRKAKDIAKLLSPAELSKIRSAAAKKGWQTRKGGMMGGMALATSRTYEGGSIAEAMERLKALCDAE